jgi:predicted CXXCH cytochrome family protein
VRRLALLLAGGAIWLFLAAIPALADGGPHVASINNGSGGINADNCAGCHRAHTAQGPYLINQADEEAMCLSCHGAAGTGSTVDVMTGVQYTLGTAGTIRGTTILGAARNGGFDTARLDAGNAGREAYPRSATDISQRPKVGVGAAEPVTSAHLEMTENGLNQPGIAWGNGQTGAGPTVTISCGSCHNPHGNGQYRILNPIPEPLTGAAFNDGWVVDVIGSVATSNRVLTKVSSALLPGDAITIAGTTFNGNYVVAAVGTHTLVDNPAPTPDVVVPYFTATGLTGLANSTTLAGTVTRTSGVKVTDAPLPNFPTDTRNYTVIQVKGTQGTDATYMLEASDVVAARASGTFNGIPGNYGPTGGDYFHRNVPWTPTVNFPTECDPTVFQDTTAKPNCAQANDAPNGRPASVAASGQVSFSEQITAWCSTCHTRYFADRNPIPGGEPATGSAWQYPRPGDNLYKYQHRTVPNRACVTCHVSHGTNAVMTGPFSSTFTYPNGTASASSRLLKIDNRGTCQACHDPTETVPGGVVYPTGYTKQVP